MDRLTKYSYHPTWRQNSFGGESVWSHENHGDTPHKHSNIVAIIYMAHTAMFMDPQIISYVFIGCMVRGRYLLNEAPLVCRSE